MGELKLIKEVDIDGKTWYHMQFNGVKVGQFDNDLDRITKEFNEWEPTEATREVIKTREI